MGNYRFRFSDMIPNAWFHKLKDMNRPRSSYFHTKKKHPSSFPTSEFTKPPQPHVSDQRKSYYFTRDLAAFQPQSVNTKPDETFVANSPRKSSSRRRRGGFKTRSRLVSSTTISAGCSCRAAVQSVGLGSPGECTNSGPDDQSSSSEPDSVLTEYGSDRRNPTPDSAVSWSSSPCKCGAENDIVIDIKKDGDRVHHNRDRGRLAPIITKRNEKPTKIQRTSTEFSERNAYDSLSVKVVKENFTTSTGKRFPTKPSGMKLRVNSPRIANYRRIHGRSPIPRRSISDSFAVVKTSKNPQRDFKESMVEMIVENNIRASKDLEELLACYLSLNSDEYHDLIINVFKQIWFEFIHLRLN